MSKIAYAGSGGMERVKQRARQRRVTIMLERQKGRTYQQIADMMGISRQRVHTILNGRADERGKV